VVFWGVKRVFWDKVVGNETFTSDSAHGIEKTRNAKVEESSCLQGLVIVGVWGKTSGFQEGALLYTSVSVKHCR
jgi:hypothetical protein